MAVALMCFRCGRSCTTDTYFECDRCHHGMCQLCWGWAADPNLCGPCSMDTGSVA